MVEPENEALIPDKDATALRLQTIAGLLDLPIDRFFDGAISQSHRDVMELLRLWQTLRTDADRTSALDYLRWVSVDSGA